MFFFFLIIFLEPNITLILTGQNNGLWVAVKVLNNNLSENIKEQFMAEVATTEGTYHIDLVRLHGFCFDLTM